MAAPNSCNAGAGTRPRRSSSRAPARLLPALAFAVAAAATVTAARAQPSGEPAANATAAAPARAAAVFDPDAYLADKVPAAPARATAVVAVEVVRDGEPTRSLEFEIGDAIDVELGAGDLAALQARAATANKKLTLFLNGHALTDLPPTARAGDGLTFGPITNEANKTFWNELWGGRLLTTRDVTVAVGLDDGSLLVTAAGKLTTEPLRGAKAVTLIGAAALLVLLTCGLALKTAMLRDAGAAADGKLATYSLGRVQMAFWFVNVVVAVLLVWAVTGWLPTITTSVLGLLGIGAGTSLGAALVDQSSDPTPPAPSRSLLRDILTDGGHVALHRFQVVVWTLVLFFVFWSSVWNRLAMPDLDTTWLALMGISSGAYVGFKFPENQAAAAAPPPKPTAAT